MTKCWKGLLQDRSAKFVNKYCFHKQIPLKRPVLLLKEWVMCLWIWAAVFQTLHEYNNTRKGHIKVEVQGIPLWRASIQLCRAIHPKTNETNKILLESAGSVAKLDTKKRIIGLKTHLVGHSTATAMHLHSYQDHSSQVRKTEAGTMLKQDMQW